VYWLYLLLLLFARRRSERRPILVRFCTAGQTTEYILNGGNHVPDRSDSLRIAEICNGFASTAARRRVKMSSWPISAMGSTVCRIPTIPTCRQPTASRSCWRWSTAHSRRHRHALARRHRRHVGRAGALARKCSR